MHLGNYERFDDAYAKLYEEVSWNGFWCAPVTTMAQPVREIRPASFTIKDASKCLYRGDERKLNHRFFMLEALSYIAGWGDSRIAKMLIGVNGNVASYINVEKNAFDGAYGPRLADGLSKVFICLTKDPWSRQAVASIWNNEEKRITRDLPCTLTLQFFAQPAGSDDAEDMGDTLLDMHVSMRSNDLNWGLPYDIAAFAEIQCRMASVLGMQVGSYHHTAGSLHYYRDAVPSIDKHPRMGNATIRADDESLFDSPVSPHPSGAWDKIVGEADLMLTILWNVYYDLNNKRLKTLAETIEASGYRKQAKELFERAPWIDRLVRLADHER